MKYLIQKIITYEGEIDNLTEEEAIEFLKANLSIIPETDVQLNIDIDGGSQDD